MSKFHSSSYCLSSKLQFLDMIMYCLQCKNEAVQLGFDFILDVLSESLEAVVAVFFVAVFELLFLPLHFLLGFWGSHPSSFEHLDAKGLISLIQTLALSSCPKHFFGKVEASFTGSLFVTFLMN